MGSLIADYIRQSYGKRGQNLGQVENDLLSTLIEMERGERGEKLLQDYTADPELKWYFSAKLAFLGGHYHWTLEALDQLVEINPDHPLYMPRLALEAETKFRTGDYRIAEKLAKSGLENRELYQLFVWLLASIHHDIGEFETSIKLLNRETTPSDKKLLGQFLILKGDCLTHLGDHQLSQEYLHQAIRIFQELDNPFRLSYAEFILAINYFYQNDHEQAIKICDKAMQIGSNYHNDQNQGRIKYTIGEIYYSLGDYQLALKYLAESRDIFEIYQNRRDLSYPYMIEGSILSYQGRYDEAITQLQKSIDLLNEVGNIQDLASSYQVLGEIYQAKNDLQQAVSYLEKSLEIKRKIGNDMLTVITLFRLIIAYLDLEQQVKVDTYQQELSQINEQSDLEYVHYVHQITQAYILKSRGRLRDKVEAMRLFEQLVEGHDLNYLLRIFIIINLCEILLDELKLVQRKDIIDDIMGYLDLIQSLAEYNGAYKLLLDIIIIRSRLKALTGRIDEAVKIIDEVEQNDWVTDELQLQLREEKQALLRQIDKLVNQVEQGTDFYELIKESEITAYLREISKMMNFER